MACIKRFLANAACSSASKFNANGRTSCACLHDFGIRQLVYPEIDYVSYIKKFCESCKDRIIYKAYDEFFYNYIILKLSSADSSCLLIGPYTLIPWNEQILLDKAQEFHISPEVYPFF
jgi:hypothetical protein